MKTFLALLVASLMCASVSRSGILDDKMFQQMRQYNAEAITPSDGANLPHVTTRIWIGGAGTLKVDMERSGTVTLSGVPAGTILDIAAKKVYATGTSATLLIAFF